MFKLLLHVDTADDRLAVAARNAANALKALAGAPASIVLVANGPAVQLLGKANPDHAATLSNLLAQGVSVRACANSLNDFSLFPDFLVPGCEVVPAAIVELVRLQGEGYAYVKP
ncbi:DsrE family protein [Fundidesulfovibrio agrisoli]|uniref:DsrE family protein n=1 Tax=Fundidesulfovibrio agrisoli TaxID=2922717 RepID=UPI001FAC33E6|nr:DsrE family protein [Fundidesulfovibrio agrisoli]